MNWQIVQLFNSPYQEELKHLKLLPDIKNRKKKKEDIIKSLPSLGTLCEYLNHVMGLGRYVNPHIPKIIKRYPRIAVLAHTKMLLGIITVQNARASELLDKVEEVVTSSNTDVMSLRALTPPRNVFTTPPSSPYRLLMDGMWNGWNSAHEQSSQSSQHSSLSDEDSSIEEQTEEWPIISNRRWKKLIQRRMAEASSITMIEDDCSFSSRDLFTDTVDFGDPPSFYTSDEWNSSEQLIPGGPSDEELMELSLTQFTKSSEQRVSQCPAKVISDSPLAAPHPPPSDMIKLEPLLPQIGNEEPDLPPSIVQIPDFHPESQAVVDPPLAPSSVNQDLPEEMPPQSQKCFEQENLDSAHRFRATRPALRDLHVQRRRTSQKYHKIFYKRSKCTRTGQRDIDRRLSYTSGNVEFRPVETPNMDPIDEKQAARPSDIPGPMTSTVITSDTVIYHPVEEVTVEEKQVVPEAQPEPLDAYVQPPAAPEEISSPPPPPISLRKSVSPRSSPRI